MTVGESGTFHVGPPAKRTGVGVLITDREDRVLLVQPVGSRTWAIPGGAVEADEPPRDAARRSLRVELGLDLPVGPLLAVDWVPPAPSHADALVLVYDAGTLSDLDAREIRFSSGDLVAYGFVALEGAEGLLSPRLERRIWGAIRARRLGRPLELEDGRLVEITAAATHR